MKSFHVVDVAAPIDTVWESLLDVDRVLAALPDAVLARDGEAVTGSVKCKLGGAQVTYRLSVRADIGETGRHTVVMAVTGKEARGDGTLAASLTLALDSESSDAVTRCQLTGNVEATGRGEAADTEAWSKLLGSLVDAVLPEPPAAPAAAPAPVAAAERTSPRPSLAVAPPLAERPSAGNPDRRMIAGVVGIVLAMLVRWRRKRRR
jgi:carbon monoxide dehydrogenase subunit G